MNNVHKETLFAELHSLLTSGLEFARAFELLIEMESNKHIKILLEDIFRDVIAGKLLWEALRNSGHFSAIDTGVVRIGEQTGNIHDALQFLYDYYQKKIATRRMIVSVISYPIAILCVTVAVVVFMLLVIVPMFEQIYSRMGGELPTITRGIISFSKSFPIYLCLFTVMSIVISLWLYMYRNKSHVKVIIANIILYTPIIGEITRKSYQSQFCKLLYLLLGAGIPLLTSLEMLSSIITLYPYKSSFEGMCDGIKRGELFSTTITKYPLLYEKKLTTLLTVGEQTNSLPQMLLRQGDALTNELEFRIRQLGTIIEPVLILIIGCLVAVILISMYLPMFKLGGIIN